MTRLLPLVLLFALGLAADVRADDALPLCAGPDPSGLPEDPGADPARRLETLARWQQEDPSASQKLRMGALYRLGRSHPAALVDADLQKARELLADAALDGELTAMASSAELELAHGDAMSGMVWAQLYAHYMQIREPSQHRTYQADLIRRGFAALPPGQETEERVAGNVRAVLDRFGPRIEAGFAAGPGDDATAGPPCRPLHQVYPTELRGSGRVPLSGGRNTVRRHDLHRPGMALFRLHIAPSGEVSQALVVESLPGPAAGEALRASVQRLRFNAVADGAPTRTVLVPLVYDDQSVRIRD
ncbi:energy transducer TonB [Arenimonas caeni]|uniref:TonB C-terminal domain-containing protein n=1 Tax=Arenimonas caeni TaxID=2058085 RepID=A0A2P6MCQ8_9GAMM|nr:hypothetical protein [Arenimonas caeni]PRH83780.1 hypothetical protein C6N40_01160 [Arenimonas caeni]